MKRNELVSGQNYIVNLGKKFKNTRVLATYIEPFEEDANASVIKVVKVLAISQPSRTLYLMLSGAMKCRMIVDNVQILA